MTAKTRWVALLCGLALALPVVAQEDAPPKETPPAETKAPEAEPAKATPKKGLEDPPLHRWGGFTLSLAAWDPSLIGSQEEIAWTDTGSGAVFQPLTLGSDARIKETVEISYHLPRDKGSVVAHYDAMYHNDSLQNFTPGQFVFLETRAFPADLGAFDDGRADGVFANAERRTREFRLQYEHRAFDSKWARGTWRAGYEQVSHASLLGIAYYAIVPNLPPAIPPVGGTTGDDVARLAPLPDTVSQVSNFTGNGLGASFDVEFPLHERVSIVSGLSIGLVRGRSQSTYVSTSSYYYFGSPDVYLSPENLFLVLSQGSAADIAQVNQQTETVGLVSSNGSQTEQSYDIYFGVQVNAYKGLKVFATLRDVSYTNVGEYRVPKPGPSSETTALNAGYEGYTVGLSWRY